MIDRRFFFLSTAALAACGGSNSAAETGANAGQSQSGQTETGAPRIVPMGEAEIDYAGLSKADWRERLSDQEFEILREEGTERPGTSPLLQESRPGTYICAGCALPLFRSETKFESGTGWPSFYTHIEGMLDTKPDYRLWTPRTEYHCTRCGGHQGHVFNDGPPPTGERWCNNGVALDFVADEA